jgi:hypothetical protein
MSTGNIGKECTDLLRVKFFGPTFLDGGVIDSAITFDAIISVLFVVFFASVESTATISSVDDWIGVVFADDGRGAVTTAKLFVVELEMISVYFLRLDGLRIASNSSPSSQLV